jgi:hypothetical protein
MISGPYCAIVCGCPREVQGWDRNWAFTGVKNRICLNPLLRGNDRETPPFEESKG